MENSGEAKPMEGWTGNVSQLAAISVTSRVPDFWTEMPRLWFVQVESMLAPQKMGDQAKYDLIVTKLGREALRQVSDILMSPPETNKCEVLKNRLLEVYEESAMKQFQKLVSGMELGSQKPSQLLRRMRELGINAKISEETLRNLWMTRLPTSVRAVLTVSQDQNLDNLANIADKVMENMRGSEVDEISTSSTSGSSAQPPLNDLITEVQRLNLEVAALTAALRDVH